MSVRLHRLTMVAERDGVMVGRPDTGSYAMFPEEGAETLRRLGAGTPLDEVAAWYERECGTPLDFDDFFEVLDDLGFLVAEGADAPVPEPVRWQRAGRWAFSWPAWCLYVALIVGAVVAMVRVPSLRPSYEAFFFTDHISLIPIVLTFTQIPLVLLHEWFHVLAGRRLGLPSTLGIGRRLYYLVAETRLDSLLSVPRRQRYLPFLAGMLLDTILVAVFTLSAAALDDTVPAWVSGMLLAISFSTLLRLVWQFMFYLETDLYHVIATALRCADLQNATRFLIKSRFRRLLGRAPAAPDEEWTDRDLVVARWYAPLLVLGYGFSLGSLAWAGIPTVWRFWSTVFERLAAPGTPTSEVIDTFIFLGMAAAQAGLLIYVTVRDRRARNRTRARQGAFA
ncbi:hypothetical protein ACFWNN_16800 [Lentzea sp. NPDC058450]|uniref:hypothetical protein n=1 Tax=Lentzea sp. NPDC058450 TaxID=3346505 RepID=UPI00365EAF1B